MIMSIMGQSFRNPHYRWHPICPDCPSVCPAMPATNSRIKSSKLTELFFMSNVNFEINKPGSHNRQDVSDF